MSSFQAELSCNSHVADTAVMGSVVSERENRLHRSVHVLVPKFQI